MMQLSKDELRADFSRELYDRYFGPRLRYIEDNEQSAEDTGVFELKLADGSRVTKKENEPKKIKKKNIGLTDLLDFYKSRGLVGEEKTCILQTLGSIHQLCFGIESLSGSGKSFTLDILLELLPEDYVYVLKQSSDKAAMYDSSSLNKAKVLVITELQKSSSKTMLEILKDLGEGKDAERIVTNHDRSGVSEQRIESGKAVIYTLALENWFKKDREIERRYFQLYTDISEEQTKRILEKIAEEEITNNKSGLDHERDSFLKKHIADCIDFRFEYANPFALSIIEQMPLKIKARSFARHYFDLIRACAKFNYRNRVNKGALFINLEDAYVVHQLYSEQFFRSVLKEPNYSKIRDVAGFENNIDWAAVWQDGIKQMREHYPAIAERWENNQTENGCVYAFSPLTKEKEPLVKNAKSN